METKTKLALNRDTYNSVLDMLNSSDKENVVVGLSIIEETDRKKGMACILMLKKRAVATTESWKEHAPATCKWLKTLGADPDQVITFKGILEIISKKQTEPSQMQFFLEEFGVHILGQIRQMGYGFIDDLEIKIKIKEHDKNRDAS
jgi:hypothetical protein